MASATAAAFVVAWALIGAALAQGAEYRVSACGPDAGNQNHLLAPSTSDPRMSAYTACPTDANGRFIGVAALAPVNNGIVSVFANAMQTFIAPPETTIRHVHLNAEGLTWNGDWASMLQASNDRFTRTFRNVAGCTGNMGSANGCVSANVRVEQDYDLPGATGFRSVVSCGHFDGCTTHATAAWPWSRSYYFIHDLDITLEDSSIPSVTATGGGLVSGRWLSGRQSVTFNASDNSGIRRTRFWADDLGTLENDERGCDYTYAVPCTNVTGGEYGLDTTRLTDGEHNIAVFAFDATDANWWHAVHTIRVDNHAPAEPNAPSVDGGEAWRKANGFDLRWTNPASEAPIERAHYEVCRADGSACSTGAQSNAAGITQLSNIRVPQPGDYTIRVWLEDAAGNVSTAKSAPIHLKFDDVPPAQAAPQHRNGWVNADEASGYLQEIHKPEGPQLPVSGITGYAVTVDGSIPGLSPDVPADAGDDYIGVKRIEQLAEGVTTVHARAVSGSGVPSPQIGATSIHVDVTPPSVLLDGTPDPHTWTRTPVTVVIAAFDPGELSGMASGPADQDVTSGGYIEWSVDGSSKAQVRGPERELAADGRLAHAPTAAGNVSVSTDGVHTVTYRAADVAGNETPEKSVTFKIDRTAPELAVFEAQERSDPRLITVAAADSTSGLADGATIELRRVSPTPGDWITLRTARANDRYYAHVNNPILPEGDYQFRATVPDQAGNEAIATSDREGSDEVLHISPTQVGPYATGDGGGRGLPGGGPDAQDAGATVDTTIAAVAVKRVTTRKCTRKGKRKRCSPPHTRAEAVHELLVGYGKGARVNGTLMTAGGNPLPHAEVTVLRRPAMSGAGYTAESSVRTNAAGAFTYRAPAGPGRTLDFHYRGDRKYKHADDQVILRVPAAATIKASRNAVRNGKTVTFSGTLRGRPYPAKGKVLDLQAYYRNKWRTFATPRAGLDGKWKYRYRFEATRGRVVYKFRIRVRASSDYPYEPGYSAAATVRVLGP